MITAAWILLFASAPASVDEISVHEHDGGALCTIHARHAHVAAIVLELSAKADLTLEGLGALDDDQVLDIDLVDRPVSRALQVVFGAVGLHASVLGKTVVIEADDDARPAILDERAEVACLQALRDFPGAREADAAEFALGRIQDRRKNDVAARMHYDALVKNAPDSPLVAEALWRSGTILEAHGEWSDAAVRFSRLANLPRAPRWAAQARLELARCLANAGDGEQALSLLDVLDRLFPLAPGTSITSGSADERSEMARRLCVRACASCVSTVKGRAAAAISMLDEAARLAPDRAGSAEILHLRAIALERAGLLSSAARAWLACADAVDSDMKRAAFERAAHLAFDSGDFVGVLFVERAAAGSGAETAIASVATLAREKLGIDAPHEQKLEAQIARAEELVGLGRFDEGASIVDPLWRRRAELSEIELARTVLVHARVVDSTSGIDAAVSVLREALPLLGDPALVRRVCALAAELYEHCGRLDRAADALGGHIQ